MKIIKIYLFIPLIGLLLFSCGRNKASVKDEDRNKPTVLVSNSQQYEFNTYLQISGTAKPNQSVKLFAMTSGYLRQLKADIGDFVKEGQTLAILENPELYKEKEKLEAELKGKKSIYERLKSVYDKTPQLTTIADVDKAEAEYESIRAQLNNVLIQINYLYVKAPFSGIVTNRYVDKGAVIQNGLSNSNPMPLFEIQDLQPIRLTIDIPETDAVLIGKNSEAIITFPELPDAKYTAFVSRIAYGLDQTTHTMKAEIDIPNADLKVRPGMYAKVEIQRSGHKDVLSVPNEAIGNLKGQSFIYVIKDGIVKKVEIKTGIKDDKFTEILDGEIKITDQIVVKGKEFCSNGATVNVQVQTQEK